MELNKILETTISKSDIVVHIDTYDDSKERTEESYSHIEENAGLQYPLLKIRNTVIDKTDIRTFNMDIGKSFLPKLDLVIDDSQRNFIDMDFLIRDDILTVFIANSKDDVHEPIHLDFKVISVNTTGIDSSKTTIVIEAELFIPKLNDNDCRTLGNVSTFDAIKTLCSDMGLGLVSNLNNTNDIQYWNQNYETNYECLKKILKRVWVDEFSFIYSFIDQYARLNIIELTKQFRINKEPKFINFDLLSGEQLEKAVEIKLTNKIEQDNTILDQFRVSKWNPINHSGKLSNKGSSLIKHELQIKDYTIADGKTPEFIKPETIETLVEVSNENNIDVSATSLLDRHTTNITAYYNVNDTNRHKYYDISFKHNKNGVNQMLKKMSVDCAIPKVNNLLYLFMPIRAELYNALTNHSIPLRNNDVGNDTQNVAMSNKDEQVLNEMFSGWYLITGLRWVYTNTGRMPKLRQYVNITKKEYSEQWKQNKV